MEDGDKFPFSIPSICTSIGTNHCKDTRENIEAFCLEDAAHSVNNYPEPNNFLIRVYIPAQNNTKLRMEAGVTAIF